MDRIAIFQINEVDPALEGFRDIFKGIADRFRSAKINKGMDPNLKVPARVGTSTMTRSKSSIAAPQASKYSDITDIDDAAALLTGIMVKMRDAGITAVESFGVFGKSNICATFVKFKDAPDKWVSDNDGSISMNIYLLAWRIAELQNKTNSTKYRAYFNSNNQVGLQLNSDSISDPSAAMYQMMEMFIGYKGGSNINVQDHAAESALEVFAFHQNSAGEFFDASEAFTASMEAFINACKKAGVKFADPDTAVDAMRGRSNRDFAIGVAAVTMFGGVAVQTGFHAIKVAGTAVGNTSTSGRYSKGKNVALYIVPLSKSGRARVYTISTKAIANMMNDDNRTFDMEKVAKRAKFIMKHANSSSDTQEPEPEMA